MTSASFSFEAFPKMARMKRTCFITEKIDGTNAQVLVLGADDVALATQADIDSMIRVGDLYIRVGSRSRWIVPGDDNYGFAGWVYRNAEEIAKLGLGRHYGEWWGAGIQRRYGKTGDDKVFSLFNAGRWTPETLPACCSVVPVVYEGEFSTDAVDAAVEGLRKNGSAAAPGFMQPEGVIVYHTASRQSFKVTLEKDEQPKSLAAAA